VTVLARASSSQISSFQKLLFLMRSYHDLYTDERIGVEATFLDCIWEVSGYLVSRLRYEPSASLIEI
jgi:hypothetical protein